MLTPDSLTDWDPLFFTRALHSPQPIILPDLASVLELKMFEIKKLKNDSRDLAQLKIASSWLLFFSLENDVLTTNMAIFSQFDGIWPLLTLCDLSFKINLYIALCDFLLKNDVFKQNMTNFSQFDPIWPFLTLSEIWPVYINKFLY